MHWTTSTPLFLGVSLLVLQPASAYTHHKNTPASSSCSIDDSAKKDCGYAGIDQYGCESKGCCWVPAAQNSVTPWCFYPGQVSAGYSLSNFAETVTGFSGDLTLIGDGTSTYGPDLKKLSLEVVYETADIIRVKITDAQTPRWEVPESVIKRPHATSKPANMNVKFTYTSSPFTFEITRLSDGKSLFKLGENFTFKDQYLEIPTTIDKNAKTFGLGESTRLNHALQTSKTYTMWAADIAALSFDKNLYGSYPYYLQMVDGVAHGAMLMNSNGMDVVLQDTSLTYKTNGGIFDMYIFNGPSPADVVSQYTSIVGRPAMMPYWSLGFHNCKYGYTSVYQVEDVVANYAAAQIPLDTQWMDIDYMQDYRDFTVDAKNFPQAEVASFVDKLHQNGQHFVPIVDPGIMVYAGYEAYEKGIKEDLFIKDIKGNYYLGQVWPGPTYFPDFLHPSAQSYWTEQLNNFHNMVEVDGIWIDMNEISNFCNSDGMGQSCANTAPNGCPAPGASQTDCCLVCTTVDSNNKHDNPPYAINNAYGKLSTKTIAMSSTQYGNVSVYDSHNIYGLTEQIATNKALTDIRKKRPFLLTRSSFLSTGVHSAKWTGDNGATWNDLKSSIISIMDFNMFGVPMIGADICGFIFDTTEELCARWIEVGAFYPFSRNHNAIGQKPQELYLWDSVSQASKNALGMRYQMLPYMYSLFYGAHTNGDTVARAVWMNFPSDSVALTVERQFMLGSAILVSPVLDQGATSVNAYFPQGYWYSFADRSLAIDASAAGVWKTLSAPLTTINVHVKGGSVVPLQQNALTTTASRQTPFTLLTVLCPGGKAFGSLFWDDGEQIDVQYYLKASYKAETTGSAGTFTTTIEHNNYPAAGSLPVQDIVIVGPALSTPTVATLNGVALTSSQFSFDSTRHSITFKNLNLKVNDEVNLSWN